MKKKKYKITWNSTIQRTTIKIWLMVYLVNRTFFWGK